MLDSDFDNDILKIKLKAKSAQAIAGPWRAQTIILCCVRKLFSLHMIIMVLCLCSADEECEKNMTGYRCYAAGSSLEGYCRLGYECPRFAVAGC